MCILGNGPDQVFRYKLINTDFGSAKSQSNVQCTKNGLVCLNRNQAGQKCHDYGIRYYCTNDTKVKYNPADSTGQCIEGWTDSIQLFDNTASVDQVISQ